MKNKVVLTILLLLSCASAEANPPPPHVRQQSQQRRAQDQSQSQQQTSYQDEQAALQRAEEKAAKSGELAFRYHAEILINQAKYLNNGAKLTEAQMDQAIQMALEMALKDTDEANKTHLANHIRYMMEMFDDKEIGPLMKKAGLTPKEMLLWILVHDLGKIVESTPKNLQAFFKANNLGDINSSRVPIHELISAEIFRSVIAPALGLTGDQTKHEIAKFMRHNAGYNPTLPGFWYGTFAGLVKKLALDQKLGFPTNYPALVPADQLTRDGLAAHLSNVVGTIKDRENSMELTANHKFSDFVINVLKKWDNDALTALMEKNGSDVPSQVKDIAQNHLPQHLQNLTAEEQQKVVAFLGGGQSQGMQNKLADAGKRIKESANPPAKLTSVQGEEAKKVVYYQDNSKQWHAVELDEANGYNYYVFDPKLQDWSAMPKTKKRPQDELFNIVYKDFDTKPDDLRTVARQALQLR